MKKIPIYLASSSPRRRQLLTQIGIDYTLVNCEINETVLVGELPKDYALRLALAKAKQGQRKVYDQKLSDMPILGADTVVSLNGEIFGKPHNRGHAQEMLSQLSGKTHRVLSAIAVVYKTQQWSMLQISQVTFKTLSDSEISVYCENTESYDKAGGYAIQGLAAAYISQLSGSYSGVMGLPLYELCQILDRIEL